MQVLIIMHNNKQGDTAKLLDDIAELKPTVFCSVPRLFNRIYDKVLAGVRAKGGLSSFLFHRAFGSKKANLDTTVYHWLWDRLVFSQVRECIYDRSTLYFIDTSILDPSKAWWSFEIHFEWFSTCFT